MAGFDVVAAVDNDPVHCATYEFNFPHTRVLCRDVRTLPGSELKATLNFEPDQNPDVLLGGCPCQGFSVIGKRNSRDPRNSLVFEFVRMVAELQPRLFVLENVPSIMRGQNQTLFGQLLEHFHGIGYQLQKPFQVLNAAGFGVPQARKRLFLLGARQDAALPDYPQAQTHPAARQFSLSLLPPSPTVADAIADLPTVENYPELLNRDWVDAIYGEPSAYAQTLRHETHHYAYPRPHPENLLTCSWRSNHTPKTIARFAQTLPGEREPVSHFDRLQPDGVSVTLRAGTNGQRGGFTAPRPIHPFLPRCITVREAARLHSYPDWFRFHATKWHGFRQVGNSVPPLVAQAIAAQILQSLNVKPRSPDPLASSFASEKLLRLTARQAARLYA